MKLASKLIPVVMFISVFVASAIPGIADETSVSNPPSTYVNANFGSARPPFNFYRSTTSLDFDSTTADVFAKRSESEVRLSALANMDPNETSSAYSAYNIGVVNGGSSSLTNVSVTAQSLALSGSAHFAMNLWFDTNKDGEYFVWQQNDPDYLTGLGGDVYAIGGNGSGCIGAGACTGIDKTVTINETTSLFLIPDCNPGVNVTTLAVINSGGCSSIPMNTPTAMWVGIDIPGGTVGSGRARIGTAGCDSAQGGGDAKDQNGNQHHHQFSGNSCDNSSSGVQDTDSQGNSFQSTSVTSSTFTADGTTDIVTMIGSGLDNAAPVTFTLVVNDFGVLAPAVYTLTSSDGRTVIGTLLNGDIAFQ